MFVNYLELLKTVTYTNKKMHKYYDSTMVQC